MLGSKIKKIIFLVIILSLLIFLFFNEYGLIKYFRLKSEITELNMDIERSELEMEQIKMEIDSLKNSLIKIEKVAREKYRMLGENEHAFKVEKK
ncbi:MAG: septum formation initiator family protein [Melioribacteraceae bacterium]|nr:septum formation initiator family protein [Melioribacteraceae bacterium]